MNTKIKENKKIKIVDFGEELELIPELVLYVVSDFMGSEQHNIGLNLYCEDEGELELYATLTTSFGEFIGQKNCTYIDTNNCSFANQLLGQGIAIDTGFTKHSGFCIYPLWKFNEEFLKEVDEKLYTLYSDKYDEYMESMM